MPTQKELAKLAGVSSGTVSNVISGSVQVSERYRQKVLEAVRALGYKPNLIARSLRMNRTHMLGMVVPDLTVPFFPKVIRGAESAARERGYFLVVLDAESSAARQSEMLLLLQAQRVEGIVLITSAEGERDEDEFVLPDVPVVFLDRLPRHLEADSVCVNDRRAAAMGVEHLLANGHKRIAIVTGPMSLHNERERVRGYRSALQKANIGVNESLIWTTGFRFEDVASFCREKMSEEKKKPTALFATNGVTALGALRGLYEAGLRTPRDFAFVSFDELTSESFFEPGITSVVQPAFEIGYRGVNLVLDRIESSKRRAYKSVRLDAKLTIRESSMRPKSRPRPLS